MSTFEKTNEKGKKIQLKPGIVQVREIMKTSWGKATIGAYKAALDKRKAAVIKR